MQGGGQVRGPCDASLLQHRPRRAPGLRGGACALAEHEPDVPDLDRVAVEDVHTLTGKNKTQEELNTILDSDAGARFIVTIPLA